MHRRRARNRDAQLSVFIREKAASFERNHQPWRRDYFSTIYIYIYTYTSSLTDRERSRTEKKKKGESSQSQDNLPLKTFAKPRQRELCFVVEMPVVPPRRLFVVEKSTTGIHVVSSFVSAFLNAPHQKDESKDRGGLLFPPSPFPPAPLCPNSTLPSPLPLSMVFFETQKNR